MKVLSHDEMRAADRSAIECGITSLVLMENAAYGLLRAMEAKFPRLATERIAIFCGKGNNGGDGMALARLLSIHHQPEHLLVLLAYPVEELSPDAAAQLAMLEALGIAYTMQWPQDLAATTIAVDALLGTGFTGEPREPIAGWIERINALPLARRLAVDIPSARLVKADLTVTFAAPKPEHVLPPDCYAMGELVIAPIGIPARFIESASLSLTTKADLKVIGQKRALDSHKGTYGHVAILGGATGKHGALELAGEAAIRGGAGWVTVCSPDADFVPRLPDLMRAAWTDSLDALSLYRVVAVGPGLGQSAEASAAVKQLFNSHPGPLVLDADALNLLAPLRSRNESGHARVLTPHPGEMKRLLGRDSEDRRQDASGLARSSNSIVVLKGNRSLIAFPDGQVWVNPTGSPALAKAGSGDVLTGLITALIAQFPLEQAVLGAVYLHGRCGELAHERTSLASQLCDHLAEAFDELS
jgi:hydroxyethylthiazole kinase-like uncharacterized protein yjeF